MAEGEEKVNVIKANYALQGKIGAGPLSKQAVERCEDVMKSNTVDFAPLAQKYLDELQAAITKIQNQEITDKKEAVKQITEPVMQLKANGKTFNYDLIGNMANIMLSFLESIKEIDNNVIEIVSAHHKTLYAIVMKKMRGDGGAYGEQLESELKGACTRYLKKMRGT